MGGAHLYYVALSGRQERRAGEKETETVLQSYVLRMAMALICALTNLYGSRCSTNTVQCAAVPHVSRNPISLLNRV